MHYSLLEIIIVMLDSLYGFIIIARCYVDDPFFYLLEKIWLKGILVSLFVIYMFFIPVLWEILAVRQRCYKGEWSLFIHDFILIDTKYLEESWWSRLKVQELLCQHLENLLVLINEIPLAEEVLNDEVGRLHLLVALVLLRLILVIL